MKKAFLPLIGSILLFTACKENGPLIDFGPKAKDTAYMAPAETPQQRKVVIEEFTGVTCSPCFAGHKDLKGYQAQYPNRLIILGIQPVGPAQSRPLLPDESKHPGIFTVNDNRTADGTELGVQIYGGISSIPNAGIDRVPDGGTTPASRLLARNIWASKIQERLGVPTAANVTVQSTYNSASRQAVITVRVAYTQAVSKNQLLNVAILENNVIDAQEGGDTVNFSKNYVHQHVFRDMITGPAGDVMLSGMTTKQPGQVYERIFIYDVNPAWNPENLHLVAYVANNDGSDAEIVQGAEVHLK